MNNFLLDFLALASILSGILVITSKNPVISVLFLISVFVNIAGYLVLLGVGFIGISYLIVYVGAIAVLFLFVIIMLNLQLAELSAVGSEYTQNLPLGAIVGSLFLFEIASIIPSNNPYFMGEQSFNLANIFKGFTQFGIGIINWFNSIFFSSTIGNNLPQIHITFNTSSIYDSTFSTIGGLQIQSIGNMLYTNGSIWLIVTSIILLLAILGPITLSINKSNS